VTKVLRWMAPSLRSVTDPPPSALLPELAASGGSFAQLGQQVLFTEPRSDCHA